MVIPTRQRLRMKRSSASPPSVETHFRRARLALLWGEVVSARAEFMAARSAAKELVPEAPETVAWCDVQLGELAFNRGDWADAEQFYRAALKAFPDYFAAIDHLGELRAAREDYTGALCALRAIGNAFTAPGILSGHWRRVGVSGKLQAAKPWHDRALAAYLKSVELGEVHFFHHLASFFSVCVRGASRATKYAVGHPELRDTAAVTKCWPGRLTGAGEFDKSVAEIKMGHCHPVVRSALSFYHYRYYPFCCGDAKGGSGHSCETYRPQPPASARFDVHGMKRRLRSSVCSWKQGNCAPIELHKVRSRLDLANTIRVASDFAGGSFVANMFAVRINGIALVA